MKYYAGINIVEEDPAHFIIHIAPPSPPAARMCPIEKVSVSPTIIFHYAVNFRATLSLSNLYVGLGDCFSLHLPIMAAALTEGSPMTPFLISSISVVVKERREARRGHRLPISSKNLVENSSVISWSAMASLTREGVLDVQHCNRETIRHKLFSWSVQTLLLLFHFGCIMCIWEQG